MRDGNKALVSIGLLVLVVLSVSVFASAASKDASNSIVITFKDGHKQAFSLSEISRIEFTPPSEVPAKNLGHSVDLPGRGRFIGKWTVGDGNGTTIYFTLEENGQASNTVGSGGHGTWVYVNGEARVSWDNGWHDIIRKIGTKFQKSAFAPGQSFKDAPNHTTDAQKTNPEPI